MKESEAAHMKPSLKDFKTIFDRLYSFICAVCPESGKILFANEAFRAAFGQDSVGRNYLEFIPLASDHLSAPPVWLPADMPRPLSHDFYEVYVEARKQWLTFSRQLIEGEDKSYYLIVCYDTSARKEYELKVESQAFVDYLTGLPNRHACDLYLNYLLERDRELKKASYVFFIDLDDFKIVNDSYGHAYGDAVLVAFASYLAETFGGQNRIFRLGGDEFVIIVEHSRAHWVAEYLKSLLACSSMPWKASDKEFYCSLSIGVVEFQAGEESAVSILKKADLAMYQAKKNGKNGFAFYSEGMDHEILQRSTLESRLREALQDNFSGFEILYQPYCALPEGRIVGAEALLRLKGKDGERILPRNFIDLMEYLGLMVPVSDHVFEESLRLCRRINKTHPDFSITINLSPAQFKQKDIAWQLKELFRSSGVKLGNIIIAVNERMALNERSHILEACTELRDCGIRVALDDFGASHASFINLRKLPVDIIKLSPEFVSAPDDDFNQRYLRLVIDLGHITGKIICQNGVENGPKLDFCMAHGLDWAQGFELGRPQVPEELEKMMAAHARRSKKTLPV